MDVRLPDGRVVTNIPEGTTQSQLMAKLQANGILHSASSQPQGSTGIVSNLVGGAEEMGSSIGTAAQAAFGDPNEAARAGLARQKAIEQAHPNDVSLQHLKDTYNNQGLWEATKELGSDIPKSLARLAPNMASGMAGARLGAMAGALATPELAGTGGIPGAVIGGIGGFALPDLIQRFGSNIEEQASHQDETGQAIDVSRGKALSAAAIQAPLDAAMMFVPMGRTVVGKVLGPEVQKLLGAGEKAAAEKLAQESLKMSLMKGTGMGLLEQAPIQVAQTMIGRAQSGQSLTGDDALHAYGEALYTAGMFAPMGAYGRLENKGAARDQVAADKAAAVAGAPAATSPADAAVTTPDEAAILGEAPAPKPRYEFTKTSEGKNDYGAAAATVRVETLPNGATRPELVKHVAAELNTNYNLAQGVVSSLLKDGRIQDAGKNADGKNTYSVVPREAPKAEEAAPAEAAQPVEDTTPAPTPAEAPQEPDRAQLPDEQPDANVRTPDEPQAGADRGSLESDIPFTAPADPASDIAGAAGLGHADDVADTPNGRAKSARQALSPEDKAAFAAKMKAARDAKKARLDTELERRVEENKAKEAPEVSIQTPETASPEKDTSYISLTQRLRDLMTHVRKTYGDDTREYSRIQTLHDALVETAKPIIDGKPNPESAAVLKKAAPVVDTIEKLYGKAPAPKPVPETPPAQQKRVLSDALETRNLNEALKAVVANTEGSGRGTIYGHLAETLSQMDFSNVKVALDTDDQHKAFFEGQPSTSVASYDPPTNTVYFKTAHINEEGILHEALHAATVGAMHQYRTTGRVGQRVRETGEDGKPQLVFSENKQQTDAAAHLTKIFDVLSKDEKLKPLRDKYPRVFDVGDNGIFEFISHGMTNKSFQRDLAGLRHPDLSKYTKQPRSMWTQFTEAVARLFKMGDAKGNVLAETSEAVHKILSRSTKSNEKTLQMAKKADRSGEASFMKDVEDTAKELESPAAKGNLVRRVVEQAKKPGFYNRLVTNWQDARRSLKVDEDGLRMAERLITDSAQKFNDIWSRITMASSRAHAHMRGLVDPHIRLINQLTLKFAKDNGLTPEKASTLLSKAFTARHESERRWVKYLLQVPLSRRMTETLNGKPASPAAVRDHIMKQVYESKTDFSEALTKKLRDKLENLAKNHADVEGQSKSGIKETDPAHRVFDVIGDHPPEYFKEGRDWLTDQMKGDNGNTIRAIDEQMGHLRKNTATMDREANYWTSPVENIVNLYGYKHYVPYKGVLKEGSKVGPDDDMLDLHSKRLSGEHADFAISFEGRQTDSENVIHQMMADSTRAAMRAGRAGVTEAIKNQIKSNYLLGEHVGDIKFADRYTNGSKDLNEKYRGKNVIYHYTPTGDIEVYRVKSDAKREAIRRTYQDTNPLIDLANQITSKIGSFHTRYNVAFHPYNFIRDAITNSFVIGAEHGLKEVQQVLGNTVATVFNGGLYKAGRLSAMFRDGKRAEIEEWAKKDPHVRDMYDFMRNGDVTFVQGMTTGSQFKTFMKEANTGRSTTATFNKYLDIWSHSFELAGRAAAFSAVKRNLMAKGRNEQTAINEAAAYTKGLANFESVGRFGKEAGALFMFFRPSATGAVRAIDSILPALMSADKMANHLPDAVRNEPAALAKFRENHAQLRKRARTLLAVISGAGMGLYTMALAAGQKDELGRNEVATDNMSIWQRNARMPLGFMGKDFEGKFLNIPWGFGFGALGSAGAQTAAWLSGNQSMGDAVVNTGQIAMDSFLPLPVSKIDPLKSSKNAFAFLTDSVMPSAIRPFFEYAMNTDTLGRSIYSDRLTKYGASYSGGENIPEIYKDTARMLHSLTNGEVDMSPNTMYFFANNYADGMARLAQSGYGLTEYAQGKKSWDTKNDFSPLSSFIGKTSPIDSRQFSDLRDKMESVSSQIRGLKDRPPDFQARYFSAHPMAPMAIQYYNKQVNGQLRRVSELKAAAIASPNLSAKQRKEIVDDLSLQQHMLQRTIIDTLKVYGYSP